MVLLALPLDASFTLTYSTTRIKSLIWPLSFLFQNYYAPQIFRSLGLDGDLVSLLATGVYGIVKVVGCLCFLLFFADSLGRRRSLLWTSAAQCIVMFIVGIYGRVEPPVEGRDVRTRFLFTCFLVSCLLWLKAWRRLKRELAINCAYRLPVSVSSPSRVSTFGLPSSSSVGARSAGFSSGKTHIHDVGLSSTVSWTPAFTKKGKSMC